jgi:hypothetical protein
MPGPSVALLAAAHLFCRDAEPPAAIDEGEATAASPREPALRVGTPKVDARAVEQGIELRVGERWRSWIIEVGDGTSPDEVDVRLHDARGRVHARSLTLEGETIDERSRALASSLALLVEQLDDDAPADPEPPTSPLPGEPPPTRHGFVAVGPRLALEARAPYHVDAGARVVGGAWLVRDHVVPVAELAWARSSAGELVVDAVRLGGGVLGGAAPRQGRLWAGAGALVRTQWAIARASRSAAGAWLSPAVVGAVDYRGRVLVVGGWVGVDLLVPPLLARGDAHAIRWSVARPMIALHVGLRLPPQRRTP